MLGLSGDRGPCSSTPEALPTAPAGRFLDEPSSSGSPSYWSSPRVVPRTWAGPEPGCPGSVAPTVSGGRSAAGDASRPPGVSPGCGWVNWSVRVIPAPPSTLASTPGGTSITSPEGFRPSYGGTMPPGSCCPPGFMDGPRSDLPPPTSASGFGSVAASLKFSGGSSSGMSAPFVTLAPAVRVPADPPGNQIGRTGPWPQRVRSCAPFP